jgi:hypothetical protein
MEGRPRTAKTMRLYISPSVLKFGDFRDLTCTNAVSSVANDKEKESDHGGIIDFALSCVQLSPTIRRPPAYILSLPLFRILSPSLKSALQVHFFITLICC